MRFLVLLLAVISTANAMAFIGVRNQGPPRKPVKGDWPARFPQHPPGFSYKCKDRQFGTVTLPPNGSIQKVQHDPQADDVPTTTHVPTTQTTTTTVKPTSTTTLKTILTTPVKTEKPSGTTFWIRSPTPPHAPDTVVKGGAAFTVGPPQFATVKIDAPHAPDAAILPFGIPSGDLDFDFKTVGTPKPPRKVIDPDA